MSEALRRSALALALVVGSGLASCGFHARQGLGPEVASLGIAVFANALERCRDERTRREIKPTSSSHARDCYASRLDDAHRGTRPMTTTTTTLDDFDSKRGDSSTRSDSTLDALA